MHAAAPSRNHTRLHFPFPFCLSGKIPGLWERSDTVLHFHCGLKKKKKKKPRFQDIKTVLNMHKPAEGNSYCAVNLCTEASSCILVSVTNKHPIIVLFFLL